jgi:hypothetical protein
MTNAEMHSIAWKPERHNRIDLRAATGAGILPVSRTDSAGSAKSRREPGDAR